MADISIKGKSPILRQGFAVGGAVRRLARGLRGRKGRGKDFKTHGKDVPTMAAKGGRIGKFGGGRTNLLEELGRVEAERSNPNRRAEISRVHGELNRGYAKGGRAGHFVGGAIKKVISKLKPKPKGKVDQKFLDFIKTGKHVDKKGVKTNVPKAAERLTGKPHVDHGIRKRIKHLGRGKAEGGRIGLKHGFQVLGGGVEGKPHSTREGRDDAGRRRFKRWTGEDWSKGPGSQKGRRMGRQGRRMGRPGRRKDFKTHGRDVTTMAAEGGRIGFKKGTDKKWMQKVSASIKKRGTKGKCTPITKPGCTGRAKALAKTFKKMARERKSS